MTIHRRRGVQMKFVIIISVLIGLAISLGVGLSVRAAQVTITTTSNPSGGALDGSNPTSVFVSDQVGYAFHRTSGYNCGYHKTTDGGATWGSRVVISGSCHHVTVWYDQWTPGDVTGTYIHTLTASTDGNTLYYNRLDTSNDTLLSSTDGFQVENTITNSITTIENQPSITKATDGTLYAGVQDGDPYTGYVKKCSSTCSTTGNWTNTNITLFSDSTSGRDTIALMPLAGGDILAIIRNFASNDMLSKVYDTSAGTWDAGWTTIDNNATLTTTFSAGGVSATVDTSTNDVYLTYQADNLTVTAGIADIRAFVYSGGSWITKTNPITNTARGQQAIAMSIDQNNKDVYVVYSARTTPSDGSTVNIYWKKSTDGMTTWGSEQGPINSSAGDYWGVRINSMSKERLMVSWHDPNNSYMYGDVIANLVPPEVTQSSYRWFENDDSMTGTNMAEPAPTIVGSSANAYVISSTPTTISLPSGIQDGDQVLVFVSSFNSDITYSVGGTGWTNYFPRTIAGTQHNVGWAKTFSTGMTITVSANLTRTAVISVTAIRDAKAPSDWILGSVWNRATYGTSTTTVAPGVTTTVQNSLVLSYFGERTTVDENDITSISNATKHLFFEDDVTSAIESIVIGEYIQESVGTTSNVTVTYPNTQASNGIAMQLAIPPANAEEVIESADIGAPLAAQDTAISDITSDDTVVRLRMNLVTAEAEKKYGYFKLQYKQQVSGACDTTGVYADITSSSPLRFHDNPNVDDGVGLTISANDPIPTGLTPVRQTYLESNPFDVTTLIPLDESGMWDIALTSGAEAAGKTYCVRAVYQEGNNIMTYDEIPQISFASVGPTLEQQMRGGQGVIAGVKYPLVF